MEGYDIAQVLAETEYQDLYRITDGVLLVVNKFKPIYCGKDKWISLFDPKVKSYNKGCQKQLKILKEDYYSKYEDVTVYQGLFYIMEDLLNWLVRMNGIIKLRQQAKR